MKPDKLTRRVIVRRSARSLSSGCQLGEGVCPELGHSPGERKVGEVPDEQVAVDELALLLVGSLREQIAVRAPSRDFI